MRHLWLLASYGRRPAGDPAASILGAASSALQLGTAELRRQQDLEAMRAFAGISVEQATAQAARRVAETDAARLLSLATARTLAEVQAAQGRPPATPSTPSTPSYTPQPQPQPQPPIGPPAERWSTGAKVATGLAVAAAVAVGAFAARGR